MLDRLNDKCQFPKWIVDLKKSERKTKAKMKKAERLMREAK